MKAKKALKRLAKIEALVSDLTERYSENTPIREVLQDAKTAVTRAKKALSLQASSGTAKNAPVKQSKPTSKATPEPSKPKRKLGLAGRKAIKKATAKKAAVKKATPMKAVKALVPKVTKKAKKAAVKTPAKEAVIVVREEEKPAFPNTETATLEPAVPETPVQEVGTSSPTTDPLVGASSPLE